MMYFHVSTMGRGTMNKGAEMAWEVAYKMERFTPLDNKATALTRRKIS